jgi:hypothetical protein
LPCSCWRWQKNCVSECSIIKNIYKVAQIEASEKQVDLRPSALSLAQLSRAAAAAAAPLGAANIEVRQRR